MRGTRRGRIICAGLRWSGALEEIGDAVAAAHEFAQISQGEVPLIEHRMIGVEAVARQAVDTAHALRRLFDDDRARVAALGRAAGSALRVYDLLCDRVIVSAPVAAEQLDLTWPTVNAALGRLEGLGIVREMTGRARNRAWIYQGADRSIARTWPGTQLGIARRRSCRAIRHPQSFSRGRRGPPERAG